MKKYIVCLFVILAILTACMSKTTNLTLHDITGIRYQDFQVHEQDFKEFSKLISQIKFQNIKFKVNPDKTGLITTKDYIYHFEISDNYRMKYTINETTYYSKDETNIKKIIDYFEGLPGKYESQAYYYAKIDEKYQKKDNDIFIKVQNNGEKEAQIVIEAKQDIYELRVHDIGYDQETGTYQDMNLVKEKSKIAEGKKVIVKGNTSLVPLWRVEIQNEYGYRTTFLPYYDESKKELILKREME